MSEDCEHNFPEFLCRACHPELALTPDERATADEAERIRLREQQEKERQARELEKAERKLAQLTKNGEPVEGSVSAKITASLRKKVERLIQ